MNPTAEQNNVEYYNEEYKVKKAKNLSDNSVLYGDMSKGKMTGILVGSAIGVVAVFVATVTLYNMLG